MASARNIRKQTNFDAMVVPAGTAGQGSAFVQWRSTTFPTGIHYQIRSGRSTCTCEQVSRRPSHCGIGARHRHHGCTWARHGSQGLSYIHRPSSFLLFACSNDRLARQPRLVGEWRDAWQHVRISPLPSCYGRRGARYATWEGRFRWRSQRCLAPSPGTCIIVRVMRLR